MKYIIALILFLAPFAAYAGGNHHNNDTSASAQSQSEGGSAKVERSTPVGQPGGISPVWTCSQAYSVSSLFLGFSYTTDNDFCMLREQKREVCFDSPESDRCEELKQAVADWEPAKAGEVSTAVE